MEHHGQRVVWLSPGRTELVRTTSMASAGSAVVQVSLTVTNPGTERARFLQLPNALVGYPHTPGIGAVGRVVDGLPDVPSGLLVAVRSGVHASVAVVPRDRL